MKFSINETWIGGNLTKDPEIRHTPSGAAVTTMRVAINEPAGKKKDGEEREEITTFVDVEVWGKTAEYVCDRARKGTAVSVCGPLRYQTWKKDGDMRSKTFVWGRRIKVLNPLQTIASNPGVDNDVPPKQDEEDNRTAEEKCGF